MPLSFFSLKLYFEEEWHIPPHLKHLKRNLHLYLPHSLFIFLIKFASSFDMSNGSFCSCLLHFYFFVSLNTNSFLVSFSFSIIISYAMRIPCNSTFVISSILFLFYKTVTFELNWDGKVIIIFCKTNSSSMVSPNHLREFTISSSCRNQDTISSSYFICSVSNNAKKVCNFSFSTFSSPS